MAKHVGAGFLVARLLVATLGAATSGWTLVVAFAFASMTGVSPSGSPQWWAAALGRLFLSSSESVIAWLLSALLLACAGIGARDLVVLLYRLGSGLANAIARSPRAPGPIPPMNGAGG
ncbi:hypothetical protein GobsT_28800 [Gemmata obscuriglobus]|uniref:Uncharacterized protein n=1 Tax=Gemmata obscuriglobus TaxID=114 RepID=A0A2Z3H3J2_9BACT|nr:hypothetical protein [Gemmata obscuriglobus]AWM38892.1 hypothetical protein C1280_19145 [Gemmata obscuriglobus]QEG28106.1 hypothetical protein GobsT_28800 [Gemmata obscuriglobus]VTS05745.1 unnamed protein product [Gemmata obscuriglobus UQM 2246]